MYNVIAFCLVNNGLIHLLQLQNCIQPHKLLIICADTCFRQFVVRLAYCENLTCLYELIQLLNKYFWWFHISESTCTTVATAAATPPPLTTAATTITNSNNNTTITSTTASLATEMEDGSKDYLPNLQPCLLFFQYRKNII